MEKWLEGKGNIRGKRSSSSENEQELSPLLKYIRKSQTSQVDADLLGLYSIIVSRSKLLSNYWCGVSSPVQLYTQQHVSSQGERVI